MAPDDTSTRPERHLVNTGPGGNLDLDNVFTYHAPTPDQIPMFEAIRAGGRDLAQIIGDLVPPGPERSTAIAKVREAVMWGNAGIACHKPPATSTPL